MPHGTTGDVLPFIWLGRQLKERGHEVLLMWVDEYKAAATAAGLEFISLKDGGEFRRLSQHPDLWSEQEAMRQGHAFADRCTALCMTAYAEEVEACGRPDLILGPMISLAARLLRDKHRIPFVSVNIQPAPFLSAYDLPSGLPFGRLLKRLPLVLRKSILSAASGDFQPMPVLKQCCVDHGVRPPRSLRQDWYHSPDGVLALFPPWYGRPQPDWPANTFQWDFPLEDLSDEAPLSPDLDAFLEAPGKKLLFTLGSVGAGSHLAEAFFRAALQCVARLGCRAVFVGADAAKLPSSLPASVHVAGYVPYSRVLNRVDAAVHAGGIGTTAQCLAAGIPQILAYAAFDQPDNAARVEKLGVGCSLALARFSSGRALPLLRGCLEDETLRTQARKCAGRLRERPTLSSLLQWLESRTFIPPGS